MMRGTRSDKVKKIFIQFDDNKDGRLNRDEMAALVIAVNPRVKFSDEQIGAILDEVFRTYGEFIDGEKGLTFEGLLRTYDDGAGDVDRDFDALGLELDGNGDGEDSEDGIADSSSIVAGIGNNSAAQSGAVVSTSSIVDERPEGVSRRKQAVAAWATSPNHGIVYDETWAIIEDLEILIKRLKAKYDARMKQKEGKKGKGGDTLGGDGFSDPGWSRELSSENGARDRDAEGGGRRAWEELGPDYNAFVKDLRELRNRADGSRTQDEAFDSHMAIGRTLFDHQLFKEALGSFKRATELKPTDVRPHFRTGNTLYALGRFSEAKESYTLALEAAEASGSQWSYLLPQIHVNLGISLESEGMLLSACEHYREAAILCPTHYRALKLLGSALFGVGEYRAAEKALEEAIFLRADYADAHCDLGSVLHAMGEDERAIQEFQKAIDLKPDHMDALYNLGGLFRDVGRYQRAAEMYSKVLAIWPNHWRAQLNKAVSLLGAGETDDAKRSLKEAFKMTNRVELYDAIAHLKQLQKRPKGLGTMIRRADQHGGSETHSQMGMSGTTLEEGVLVVESARFRRASGKTTPRQYLVCALDIRAFQRLTRLNRCDINLLKKELTETRWPLSQSGSGVSEKTIRKAALEKILRRLLHFLKPETFQGAVKAVNERLLTVLDETGSGRVDLGFFFAVLAPICAGPPEKRKRYAFDALVWRSTKGIGAQIGKVDASSYIRLLRAVYLPSGGVSDMMEVHGEDDAASVSFPEFLEMFDDPDWGFGIMNSLVKLETGDRVRHGRLCCAVCSYPITGPRFKEVNCRFSLCSICYSEGKVPVAFKQEEYKFKEYGSETEAMKDKLRLFG
uniref:TSA: Wollemia nobilis Ref_Wollemi_Transcript_28229_3695 transcribed RNA sequence n=1 Tax=Wollemia nobilis TaxID=56998 RepID=A0A0C9QLL8_9CONI